VTAQRNCESYQATYALLHGESVDPEDEGDDDDDDGVGKWEKLEQTEGTVWEFRKFS
jgi:hypothetical protein